MAAFASPFRSLLWSGLETLGTLAVGLASVIVIARLLGPDAFGLASIGLGLTLVVVVFINSLVHDGLVRSPDYSDRQLASAFGFSLLAGLAGSVALALAALPLARLLDQPSLVLVLLAFLPMVLAGALAAPLIAERRRALDFPTVGRHQLASRCLGLALGLALAATGFGVWSVVGQHLLTSSLLMLSLTVARKGLPPLRIDWPALRPVLSFSRNIALTGLVVQLTERLFLTLVGYLYGLAAAGQWAVAARLIENITGVLSQIVYHVGLAHLAPLREQRQRLAELAALNRDLLILALLPGLAALAAAAEPLVALLFGPVWSEVAELAVWLLLGALFVVRRLLSQVALNVVGRSQSMLLAVSVEGVAALALLAVFLPFGAVGAAAARGLSFVAGWLIISAHAGQTLDLGLWRECRGLGLDLAVAIGAVGGTLLLLADIDFATRGLDLLAHGALAGGMALGLLLVLRRATARWLVDRLAATRRNL